MTLFAMLAVVLSTPNFPAALSQLSAGPVVDCTMCHQGQPMVGTVTTPFGAAMRQRGLRPGDEGSLKTAFMAMSGVDSDGDGALDVDELKTGDNPNVAAGKGEVIPVPAYGCSSTSLVSVFGLGLVWLRWRRLSLKGFSEQLFVGKAEH